MTFNPEYNYHRGIAQLRAEIRRLVGGNLADQQQIKDHVEHLRNRIAILKYEYVGGREYDIEDEPIDFSNPPVSTIAEEVLEDETGMNPPPSADPGNGMVPEPSEGYTTRSSFMIENHTPKVASGLQSDE